jgi:hypothetical protein
MDQALTKKLRYKEGRAAVDMLPEAVLQGEDRREPRFSLEAGREYNPLPSCQQRGCR